MKHIVSNVSKNLNNKAVGFREEERHLHPPVEKNVVAISHASDSNSVTIGLHIIY
jgi:hypothetical protein